MTGRQEALTLQSPIIMSDLAAKQRAGSFLLCSAGVSQGPDETLSKGLGKQGIAFSGA